MANTLPKTTSCVLCRGHSAFHKSLGRLRDRLARRATFSSAARSFDTRSILCFAFVSMTVVTSLPAILTADQDPPIAATTENFEPRCACCWTRLFWQAESPPGRAADAVRVVHVIPVCRVFQLEPWMSISKGLHIRCLGQGPTNLSRSNTIQPGLCPRL